MTRWSGAGVGLLLLTFTTVCASAASPKRVLILDPFERDVAPFSAVASAFRSTLARDLGEPVECYEVPLDLARIGPAERELALQRGQPDHQRRIGGDKEDGGFTQAADEVSMRAHLCGRKLAGS